MGDMGEDYKAFKEYQAERRAETEPRRIAYVSRLLKEKGYNFEAKDGERIVIHLLQGTVTIWPYTGWFQGQKPYGKIKGRGVKTMFALFEKEKVL